MRFASYGPWSWFAPGTADPESYVEQALDGEAAECDLYLVAAAFRRAVDAKLPEDVTLAGTHFLGPDRIEDCDWDRLDIGALIREVDVPVLAKGLVGPSALRAADNSR